MVSKIIIISLLLGFTLNVYSQATDTSTNDTSTNVKAHYLDEVVVKSKNVWIEGDKYIFIPQKKEKNLSRTVEDLISRMHIGILVVENGQILTRSGQPTSVFINGVPADNIDKSTFWAKNTLRVEYMEYSDDSQFHGATNIVNFIIKDYIAGGLTKLEGNQQIPNNGNYSAASKLVCGKMTYNAIFKGGYLRDHQSGANIIENYENIYYKDQFYNNVSRQEKANEINRANNIYGGFNARFRSDKTIMMHSMALQWDEDPGSITQGTVAYFPKIIPSDKMSSRSCAHSLSPKLEGFYSFVPSSKWSFSANWVLSHSHNNVRSFYEDLGLNPLVTASKENIYNVAALLSAVWNCRNNLIFQFSLQESRTTSKTGYTGEVTSNQWQNTGSNLLQALGWLKISNHVVLTVKPQLTLYDWNVNHNIKKTEWLPGVNATLAWTINDKNRINFESWYYQKNPASSQRNDLIIRSTELKWIEGNPFVAASSNYWLSLTYNTYPNYWLNSSLSLHFKTTGNEPYLNYRSGGEDFDGVIGQYSNAATYRSFMAAWSFGIDLFDDQLHIGNQLNYNYQRINGRGIGNVRTRPYITWYFGNCSLSANYGSPEKSFRHGGFQIVRWPSYYNLDFSYGNGNLILDLELSSPFHKYLNTSIICNNGSYHFDSKEWSNGRNVSLSLTYTFGYGKNVNPGVEIYVNDIKSSSVLISE